MKVLECKSCGARVIVDKDCKCPCGIVCCDEKMVELIPNSVDAAIEKHVPVYVINEITIEVKVNHVMDEDHYIEWIALETGEGINIKYLKPGEKPEAEFYYRPGVLYAYCNKHGLWKGEIE